MQVLFLTCRLNGSMKYQIIEKLLPFSVGQTGIPVFCSGLMVANYITCVHALITGCIAVGVTSHEDPAVSLANRFYWTADAKLSPHWFCLDIRFLHWNLIRPPTSHTTVQAAHTGPQNPTYSFWSYRQCWQHLLYFSNRTTSGSWIRHSMGLAFPTGPWLLGQRLV